MNWFKPKENTIIKYIIAAGVVILVVFNFHTIMGIVSNILRILSPIFVGGVIAFVLNLPMKAIEKRFMPRSRNKFINKIRRPISIFLSIIIITLILFVLFYLVVPQLIGVINQLIQVIPEFFSSIQTYLRQYEHAVPELTQIINFEQFDVASLTRNAVNWLNDFGTDIFAGAITTIGSVVGFLINFVLSLMVALFILMGKENLMKQTITLSDTYLPAHRHNQLMYVARVFKDSFEQFLVGEVISATILGLLVTVGMWVFQFPYATMVGVLTGVTALIPYIGAYLSGAVGFLLIFVQSPLQAFFFLIFIVVIQQLEGNLIYPRVVGNSIGLPGLWVIIAITLGGGLMGVVGMLLFVPIFSALFKIIKDDLDYRRNKRSLTPAEKMAITEENNPDNIVYK